MATERLGSLSILCVALTLCATDRGLTATISAESEMDALSPEQVGMDSAALIEMFDYVRDHQIPVHSVQIVRHGHFALDAYFYPFTPRMRHDVASVTKSITSTLIGLAIDKGYLPDVHQPVVGLFRNRSVPHLDDRKRLLTVEHLLTMQAGWDCGVDMKDPRINLDARLAEMRRTADWVQFALDLPMVADPGSRFAYCNANCHLLSALLTQATGTNELAFARKLLFEPLGIRDVDWPADPQGNSYGWSDLQLRPRDMAKLGQMLLQRGRWGRRQIVPEAWLSTATAAHVGYTGNDDHYGYFWWVPGERYPGVFEAVGRGGQRITVWPARDLVLVFTGGGFDPGDLSKFILKALKSDAPLPTDPKTTSRLHNRVEAAAKPPTPHPKAASPAMETTVSRKLYKLSPNGLGLTSLALGFNRSAQATAEIMWDERPVRIPVGLEGVPLFSDNPLIKLPQAATGQWLTDDTFELRLDLVGGINFYRITLKFGVQGRSVQVALSERTGLNEETFTGVASE